MMWFVQHQKFVSFLICFGNINITIFRNWLENSGSGESNLAIRGMIQNYQEFVYNSCTFDVVFIKFIHV
jgi:hypothetical protein